MKKIVFCCLILLGLSNVCQSQEWMTSFDIAKRLALVQDKMLLMVWEESTIEPYPTLIIDKEGPRIVNLFEDERINEVLWECFVPVKVSETKYEALFKGIEDTKDQSYINKFNDDSIKIMDVNGHIINTTVISTSALNFDVFIKIYALNTSFLKEDLKNYRAKNNFYNTFRLASRYLDYAIFVNEAVRPEIINVSIAYLDEADNRLLQSDIDNKMAFQHKSDLLRLKTHLILNKPKKVLRQLKKLDPSDIDTTNESLVAFLYFTAYRLLKDEKKASLWRTKVSLVNLKKAVQIVNINS